MKVKLSEMPWMGSFRSSPNGLIMKKTELVKDDKIGAYNPFGDIFWYDRDLMVIVV